MTLHDLDEFRRRPRKPFKPVVVPRSAPWGDGFPLPPEAEEWIAANGIPTDLEPDYRRGEYLDWDGGRLVLGRPDGGTTT